MTSPAPGAQQTFLHLAGELLAALPEGGLWWERARMLVVSDLHLEKGSSFAAAGQMLPPYDTAATLSRIEALAARLSPQTIISLGDSFHDPAAEARLPPPYAARIRALTAAHDWVWVEGNHDPVPPAHLGGRALRELRVGPLIFRHEPRAEPGEVAGHLHPAAKVAGRGRSVRRRCFATDGARLVMPAMGAYAGGLNICDPVFRALFPEGCMAYALGADRVYGVSQRLLLPDGPPAPAGTWRLKGRT